ncbi:FAD-dependent oxidoreductase [Amycolatopsis sp.]|uniref:FAD-dependent oxidoreductase n=1 Tax=Amycolatopsis sp. TaxID=37632 RepID=UPI002E03915C|nr:FAD-dependent oxidoreductase [Amycolatopsis sp.]
MSDQARVVVIGAGPSGLYTADELRKLGHEVDIIDRLACPYGLLRYGVAPDHLKMKSLETTLRKILERPTVRFLGGIRLGDAITVPELAEHYDAIVYATGASVDRKLGIPGEDLPGSFSATEFVSWYCGHPDSQVDKFTLDANSAVVVGNGNVAIDVVRVLAKDSEELRATDMSDHVLDVLDHSAVTDVHLVGRRGPAQAKFTTKELRELGELANADIVVDPAELELDDIGRKAVAEDATLERNYGILREWSERPPEGRSRRVHLRFLLSPRRVIGADGVTAVELERNAPDGAGGVRGTGETTTIHAQLLLRSIGYRGLPLPGVPFDEQTGTIPHERGRVRRDGSVSDREYVVGWIKRGPSGVIGTNKLDAKETVGEMAEHLDRAAGRRDREPKDLRDLLAARDVSVVTWEGWQAIDAAERALGERAGRARIKIADPRHLLAAAGLVLR